MGKEVIEAVRSRLTLSALAGRYVRLQRSGREWKGLCPFHHEKTPSFCINDDKGLFYCHGCGAGGDLFAFYQQVEGLSFEQALEILARELGIPYQPGERREDGLAGALDAAQAHFSARRARVAAYLAERGIAAEAAERFGLGYDDGTLPTLAAHRKGLEVAGLVQKGQSTLRGRLTIPIRSVAGRVVGFSGRALDGRQPKYLHTRESRLWQRRNTLYGLYEAKELVRRDDYVLLVEGQIDAIRLQQMGIPAVASFGTSLSEGQIAAIRRIAPEATIYLAYDRDPAGIEAALKALHALRGLVGLRIVVWPRGIKDAGEATPEQVREALEGAYSPAAFVHRYASWRFPELDRRLEWLKPWLNPVEPTEALPHELRELLRAEGVSLPGATLRVATVTTPKAAEAVSLALSERVRLLEADIIALLVGVRGPARQQLCDEVELEVLPEAGGLLAPYLEALRSGRDPLGALAELGGGDVLYGRLMQAPVLSVEEARPRLAILCRLLRMAYLEAYARSLQARIQAGESELIGEWTECMQLIEYEGRKAAGRW